MPEIARDLPSNYEEGQRVFDARLKAKFPVGTSEDTLIRQLTEEGFEVRPSNDGRFATFSDKGFPVASVWPVGWRATDGKVVEIWGIYGGRGP